MAQSFCTCVEHSDIHLFDILRNQLLREITNLKAPLIANPQYLMVNFLMTQTERFGIT